MKRYQFFFNEVNLDEKIFIYTSIYDCIFLFLSCSKNEGDRNGNQKNTNIPLKLLNQNTENNTSANHKSAAVILKFNTEYQKNNDTSEVLKLFYSDIITTDKADLFLNYLNSKSQELNDGDNLLIFIDTHGWPADENELSHSVVASDRNMSLDELKYIFHFSIAKGIKIALIDESCFSGYTYSFINDFNNYYPKNKICLITGDYNKQVSTALTSDAFLDNLKIQKITNLENVFYNSLVNIDSAMNSSPGINSPILYKYYDNISVLNTFLSEDQSVWSILKLYTNDNNFNVFKLKIENELKNKLNDPAFTYNYNFEIEEIKNELSKFELSWQNNFFSQTDFYKFMTEKHLINESFSASYVDEIQYHELGSSLLDSRKICTDYDTACSSDRIIATNRFHNFNKIDPKKDPDFYKFEKQYKQSYSELTVPRIRIAQILNKIFVKWFFDHDQKLNSSPCSNFILLRITNDTKK